MSIEIVARVLNTRTGLTATAKMILTGLANHANPDGTKVFPSIARLAEYAECDERTVQRHLRKLREAGWIEVAREATHHRPTEYRIRGDRLSTLESRGDISAQSGVTSQTARGDIAVSPRTVIEPSVEPSSLLVTPEGRLCSLLADLVEENGSKRPRISKAWLLDAERMLRIDGRDPDQAERLIRWSQASPFWRGNIRSMPTFRAQYDQLRLKSNGNGRSEDVGSSAWLDRMMASGS